MITLAVLFPNSSNKNIETDAVLKWTITPQVTVSQTPAPSPTSSPSPSPMPT